MSYETGYETQLTPEESEQLRYVVTGDENEEIETLKQYIVDLK